MGIFLVLFLWIVFNTASSATPQIPLWRRTVFTSALAVRRPNNSTRFHSVSSCDGEPNCKKMNYPEIEHAPPIGYNDFNNLVMQTLWWWPNKILRQIHKKDFRFFELFPAHLKSKCTKHANKSKKKFIKKLNVGIKKRKFSRWFPIC